jgi:hypothetical protein
MNHPAGNSRDESFGRVRSEVAPILEEPPSSEFGENPDWHLLTPLWNRIIPQTFHFPGIDRNLRG